MIRNQRLIACGVLSVAAHIAFAHEMRRLPAHASDTSKRVVSIRVVSPPPPPPPAEPPPPPEAPKPQPVVHEHVRAHPTPTRTPQPVAESPPPPDIPRPTADPSAAPVFGVDMESTSPGGSGPSLPIGNSGRGAPAQSGGGNGSDRHAAPVADGAGRGVRGHQDAAAAGGLPAQVHRGGRQAGTEGTVVLEVTIDEKGRARDIKVVSGLPHGLTEAAIAALKACRFSPGERDGKPVPVRLGATKFRFFESEAE